MPIINFIKSDKNSPIIPEFRLSEVFKAALANNCIKVVEAITKSIDPSYLYDALRSILEENRIKSEGVTVFRYYKDLIEATINSLTPELSWKIIEMDAGVANSGSTSHTKVVEAVIKSIDPLFLYNALKSSVERNYDAEDSSLLEYHKNLIRITINFLTPELSSNILLAFAHSEVATTIVNSISSEHLCQVLYLSLEQNDYVEMIRNIINSACILHSDNYGKAFVQAVENQLIDVVQLFINSSWFKTLSSDYLDRAFAISNVEIRQMIKNRVKNLNINEF